MLKEEKRMYCLLSNQFSLKLAQSDQNELTKVNKPMTNSATHIEALSDGNFKISGNEMTSNQKING